MPAEAEDERFETLPEFAEAWETNAPTIVPETRGVLDAQKQVLHVYASLLMSTETGTEAHPIVDSTPGESGLEAWRRCAQRFDPATAHTHLSIMSKMQ